VTAQLRRAVVSVSSNIAEGHSRQGREFANFLSIAMGSLAEVESQLLLAVALGFLDAGDPDDARILTSEIRRMLARLRSKILSRKSVPNSDP
jgi:four helix bundle protein